MIRWRDSLWHRPLRTLRRCGDMPFLQWTHAMICLIRVKDAEIAGHFSEV